MAKRTSDHPADIPESAYTRRHERISGVPGLGDCAPDLPRLTREGIAMAATEASTRIGNLLFDAFPPDVRTAFLGGGQFRKITAGEEYVRLGDEVRSTY